jgi:hypothetical protein
MLAGCPRGASGVRTLARRGRPWARLIGSSDEHRAGRADRRMRGMRSPWRPANETGGAHTSTTRTRFGSSVPIVPGASSNLTRPAAKSVEKSIRSEDRRNACRNSGSKAPSRFELPHEAAMRRRDARRCVRGPDAREPRPADMGGSSTRSYRARTHVERDTVAARQARCRSRCPHAWSCRSAAVPA